MNEGAPVRDLDPRAIARLGSLSVQARIIVEGALSGMHRARLHGASVEFAEHKEYSPGDEIRHIDWKAYAKLDRYYVKQFDQESQLVVYLVLDASASMSFAGGGIAKLDYGTLCLAALAHVIIGQRDQVGLVAFGESPVSEVVPPRARPTHLHDLMTVLSKVRSGGGRGEANAADALERVAEMARKRRGLIVLASDLFDSSGRVVPMLRRLRAQRHDVAVLHVLDPHERTFPYEGLTRFDALESEHRMLANPQAMRTQYLARMNEFLTTTQTELSSGGVDYTLASTDRAFDETLIEFLVNRKRGGTVTATERVS